MSSALDESFVHLIVDDDVETVDLLRRHASELGHAILSVDCSGVYTKEDLLDELGKALRFPEYYGRNWDAVDECIRDMAWIRAKGYLVLFIELNVAAQRIPGEVVNLVDVVDDVIYEWRAEGTPFNVVVEVPSGSLDDSISLERIVRGGIRPQFVWSHMGR